MTTRASRRQRFLSIIVVVCVAAFAADVITLIAVGDVSPGWWIVAVPGGLLLVPVVAIAALVMLWSQRRAMPVDG